MFLANEKILKRFYEEMSKLKFDKVLHVTFDVGKKSEEEKMTACGAFIINAPWQLEERLKVILPEISEVLKK